MSENNKRQKLEIALDKARTAVRGNVKTLEAAIVDFYERGEDKNDGTLIQPLEVQVGNEEDIRRYVLRGEDAIELILGEPNDEGKFPKLEYNEKGIPIKGQMPDIRPNKDGIYWYGIKKL